MIVWLPGPRTEGFQSLIPMQFIPVDALRVAPGIDTPACTPGSSAAGVDLSTDGIGRAHLSFPVHGPAVAGAEQNRSVE